MIILPDRNIARPTKYLKPIPRQQWYGPHPYGPDVKLEFNTWIAQAYRASDHSMVWHGHFDDRDDADAFMWALYSGTLKTDPYLKRLPIYCYRFDQRQIPIWAPGGFDPEILEEYGIMYNMVSNIGIGPSDGTWTAPGDCWGLANRAGEFVDAIGPGGGGGAGNAGINCTGGGGGGFARLYSLPIWAGYGVGFGVGSGGAGGAATPDARGGNGGTAHTWFWQQQNPGLRAHAGGGGNVAPGQTAIGGGGGGGADAGAYGNSGGRGGNISGGNCTTGAGGAAGPNGGGWNGGDGPPPNTSTGGGAANANNTGAIYGPWGPGNGGAGAYAATNGIVGGHGGAYGGGGGAGSQPGSIYWHQYGGNGAGGLIVIRYEPQYAPTVYWISPSSGPTAGGQAVRINGSYTAVTGADIGGAYLTGVTWNGTDVYGTTAPGGAGTYNVSVHRSGGPSPGVLGSAYTYVAPPSVSSASPSSGPTGGGNYVAIYGANMSGVTAIYFNGVPATSISNINANGVQCYAPAGAAGACSIAVYNGYGGGAATVYTYVAPPSVSSCSPASGPTGGGNYVVVNGTNMAGVTVVHFNGVPASSVGVIDGNRVQCYAPAGAAGGANVAVYNVYGGGSNWVYTYVTPPSLSAVSSPVPPMGLIFGGTDITLTGANLDGATDVRIGGVSATNVVVVNANTITCRTPAHAAGLVSITAANGYGTATLSNCFTYLLPASGFNMPMMGI